MKKIGLVLSYKETNYGAQLQAFATQVVVEKFGHSTEIIDYSPKNGDRHIVLSRGILRFFYEQFLFKRRAKKHTTSNDQLFLKNKQERIEQYQLFIKRRLHNIVKVSGYSQLASCGKKCDAVLI